MITISFKVTNKYAASPLIAAILLAVAILMLTALVKRHHY